MSGFDIDVLRSRIGTTFRLRTPERSGTVAVELTEVSDLAPKAASIVFSGPAEPSLPQATYELTDADGGSVSLFLVPIGPGANAPMRYEAIINNESAPDG